MLVQSDLQQVGIKTSMSNPRRPRPINENHDSRMKARQSFTPVVQHCVATCISMRFHRRHKRHSNLKTNATRFHHTQYLRLGEDDLLAGDLLRGGDRLLGGDLLLGDGDLRLGSGDLLLGDGDRLLLGDGDLAFLGGDLDLLLVDDAELELELLRDLGLVECFLKR